MSKNISFSFHVNHDPDLYWNVTDDFLPVTEKNLFVNVVLSFIFKDLIVEQCTLQISNKI